MTYVDVMRSFILLSLVACSPAPSSDAPTTKTASTAYDTDLAAMQKRVREADGGACFVAEYGTCGELRYLEDVPGGLVGTDRYYDAHGALVATRRFNVEHPGATWEGPAQSCARKPTADLCAKK